MTSILFLTTSPRGTASVSTQVATTLVDSLTVAHPGATVVTRDLGAEPLPHIDEAFTTGLAAAPEARTDEQQAAVALSDALVAELMAADIVVIASAMINFSITSTLKSWFDHLARAGITFRYTDEGVPEGLITGKKVYVVLSTGGVYSAAPADAFDFQAPYVRHMLGFMGLSDVEFVRVEGSIFGPEAAEKAVNDATAQVHAVAAQTAA